MLKICSTCKQEKSVSEFTKDKSKKDLLKINCINCCKEYFKKYHNKNKEKEKERAKKYNKEKRIIDKVSLKKYKAEYYQKNKVEIEKKKSEYRKLNKYVLNEKRNNNILSRLNTRIGNSIRYYLHKGGYKKECRTHEILGCSFEEFKSYLESKFDIWMSWDNYGKYNGEFNYGWDIDHIKPISSAKTKEEIIKLNHYTNLQPLCSYTNRYIKINNI